MPGALDVALAEDRTVAERARRLAPAGRDRLGQLAGSRTMRMPRPPPPADAFTITGNSSTSAGSIQVRQQRQAGLGHPLLRLDLRAHDRDRLRVRTDPGQPGVDHRLGEVGPLGQESVARVDRVRAGPAGRVDDQITAQVRRGRRVPGQVYGVVGLGDVRRPLVRVGVDRDGLDAHGPAGGEDAAGDLTAVRDQQSANHVDLLVVRTPGATSGRRRSPRRPELVHCGSPTGRCRGSCGCPAGR